MKQGGNADNVYSSLTEDLIFCRGFFVFLYGGKDEALYKTMAVHIK